ncbi:MAG: NAD(P)-dependent oxidoreductase [Candidatus Dadabacteria bacterium]|nr:MAG: NAD(P)-dependent oxidoreductase [Candidatus Dadabacteria bacterium]
MQWITGSLIFDQFHLDGNAMKVLITGAFGNIGGHTMRELLAAGHSVRAFDLDNATNRKTATAWGEQIDTVWGDITDPTSIARAAEDVDAIIHLAAVIPPMTDQQPELAERINVGGTRHVIDAALASAKKPHIVFASSIATYGRRFDEAPPRRADEELRPEDNYGRHKVECERMIRESGLTYTILRLAAVPPVSLDTFDPIAFDIHPETRIEFVHPADVGIALANTIGNERARNKVFLIGGGEVNQFRYGDWINAMFTATGIGPLPTEAFGPRPFYTDWMDTAEAQDVLQFQHRTWEDYQNDIRALLGWRIVFVRLLRPFIRRALLKKSPYWQQFRKGGALAPVSADQG